MIYHLYHLPAPGGEGGRLGEVPKTVVFGQTGRKYDFLFRVWVVRFVPV